MDGQQKQFYQLSPAEALDAQQSRREGLTQAEASQRFTEHGPNTLEIKHKESLVVTYARQFKDLMVVLLLASSVISFALGDPRTAYVLLALVVFNTTIGFFQEFKAEKVMQSLERLVVGEATVIRNGKKISIPSSEVTFGDMVYLEEGNAVPADLRLVEENELSANDFALTGESNPVRKFTRTLDGDLPLANRNNIVYMGTTVATGQAYGFVVGIGMQT